MVVVRDQLWLMSMKSLRKLRCGKLCIMMMIISILSQRSSNFMKKKFKSSSNSFASSSSAMTAQYHHGGQTQSSGHLLTAPDRSHSSAGLPLNSKGHQEQQDDEEDEMMPPHEWIAKRLARSHISSSSVCEGAGRTLKGRDLSRVRNAVLTKTGFIEQ
ncbi:unnamed protein product [Rhodiola kirilowii]